MAFSSFLLEKGTFRKAHMITSRERTIFCSQFLMGFRVFCPWFFVGSDAKRHESRILGSISLSKEESGGAKAVRGREEKSWKNPFNGLLRRSCCCCRCRRWPLLKAFLSPEKIFQSEKLTKFKQKSLWKNGPVPGLSLKGYTLLNTRKSSLKMSRSLCCSSTRDRDAPIDTLDHNKNIWHFDFPIPLHSVSKREQSYKK